MKHNRISDLSRQRGIATLMVVLLVLVVLLAAGAAAGATYFYVNNQADKTRIAKKKPAPPIPDPVFVKIDPFTVNLKEGNDDNGRVLYIGLSLEVASQATAKRVSIHMPQVRNRILMTLADQSADTLATSAGKRKLALAVRDAVRKPYNEHGQPLKINNVLFTDFIVQ